MIDESIKYAFCGTGLFAAKCLETLNEWVPPSFVVTARSTATGRGKKIRRLPVGELVSSGVCGDIPLIESPDVSGDDNVLSLKRDIKPDFMLVADFGQFIREPLLSEAENIGCLNIHPSDLPRYRGAAPIQRALMDGAAEIGVTVFKLSRGMDAGSILLRKFLDVRPEDDYGSLRDRAAESGARALAEFAGRVPAGSWVFEPQNEAEATYAPRITPGEERIDWNMTALRIEGIVRALSPKPGAWTTLLGRRLAILTARQKQCEKNDFPYYSPGSFLEGERIPTIACGEGFLEIITVLPEGKKPLDGESWKNGLRIPAGERFA